MTTPITSRSASIAEALDGLADAMRSVVVELRLQRVAIAKLAAQRELDKEETHDTIDQLGQRVVRQEGRVGRLELVRPAPLAPSFEDEIPTRPDGPHPPRPPIPRYPRRP